MDGSLYEQLYAENSKLKDDLARLQKVRDEQKVQAGFSESTSFDVVWQKMIAVWNDRDCTNTQEMRTKILCEIDTGADYLVARKAVAKLSGLPVMAYTFDQHIEEIQRKLEETKP